MRNFICVLLVFLSAAALPVQAGVIIGGTRFVFGEKQNSLNISLRNNSDSLWLVNTRVLNGGDWPGSPSAIGTAPFMATPPLFSLGAGRENKIRLVRTGGNLPSDRESLFTLSIATIPAGRPAPDAVQLAVRSRLKLFWRPSGLAGEPQEAYRQLCWQASKGGLVVTNPTPFYVTLFQLTAGGRTQKNAGMVAPFTTRQTGWCPGTLNCIVRWQSINDYGRVMPAVSHTASDTPRQLCR